MTTIDASRILRPDLLDGVSVLVASEPGADSVDSLGAAVCAVCAGLGAQVSHCWPLPDRSAGDDGSAVEDAAKAALEHAGGVEVLVVDGAKLYDRGLASAAATDPAGESGPVHSGGDKDGGERAALRMCLDATWNLTRAVANLAFLPDRRAEPRPTRPVEGRGRIIYLAPPPDAGEHADAARAGLENLARSLSIEWARHGITIVTLAPGKARAAREVAALTAYLASPAGAYFSGCLLDLRGPAVDSPAGRSYLA